MRDDLEEILSNLPRQASLPTHGHIRKVLVDALETFPDAHSASAAYIRALWHWYHGRQADSKRGALKRLEDGNDIILARLDELERQIQAIRASLADSAPPAPASDAGSRQASGL